MLIIRLIILVLGTTIIVWVSRSSLRDVQSHGFYRFFAWELILVLFVLNVIYWIIDPFSLTQIIAWAFLTISLVLIFLGVRTFRKSGNIDQARDGPSLVGIEKTTELVTSDVYRYIRHPFYSSLLFLAWGIFFKRISLVGVVLAISVTTLLIITVQKEEIENIAFFGEKYQDYMQRTKMFIPFIL
ncbi:methyltransferase family protein [Chloroflexota bacterium]